MTRYFFFVLLFPPALMDLLLVRAHPTDLTRYFLAGYAIAAIPAVAIALVDEFFEHKSTPARAAWCGLAGFVLSPIAMGLVSDAGLWTGLQTAACGGVVAFLCTMAFCRLMKPARQMNVAQPLPVAEATAAS